MPGASRGLCALATVFLVVGPADARPAPPPSLADYMQAFSRGDLPAAQALASARLRRDPSDTGARIVLARVDAAMGRFDAAWAGLREALRRDPDNPDVLYFLGITAGALAQVEYQRVLELAPDSARAHQLQAESLEARGKAREAESEYEAALAKSSRLVEVIVALGDLARGDLAQSPERFAQARRRYERALELAPTNYDALYGLAACDAYEGDHAGAIEHFRRALAQEPDAATARLGLGASLLQIGQVEAAVAELETAVRIEPRMRQGFVHLARAYHLLGREEDARRVVERARELGREERAAQAGEDATAEP